MKGFWQKLREDASRRGGIFVLAPMADVTDPAMRRVIAKYGKPDAMWTEFVSADGLVLAPEEGRQKLMRDLLYSEAERPIVAQFFTSRPEHMRKAAELARELGFDGVDINMGCPDSSIEKQGAGAALMKTPKLAQELIAAAKEGARDLPVSVKTRLGYNRSELEEWLPALLEAEPAAVTIHARTRKEMSKVPARWDEIRRAVEIRDEYALRHAQDESQHTLILGNGDVMSVEEGRQKVSETGCDGVMLGRAIFGNPWLFRGLSADTARKNTTVFSAENLPDSRAVALRDVFSLQHQPTIREKLEVLVEHIRAFDELLGDIKNFYIMKKHFKAYVSGFDGAVDLRTKLMDTSCADEAVTVLQAFLSDF